MNPRLPLRILLSSFVAVSGCAALEQASIERECGMGQVAWNGTIQKRGDVMLSWEIVPASEIQAKCHTSNPIYGCTFTSGGYAQIYLSEERRAGCAGMKFVHEFDHVVGNKHWQNRAN